MKGFSKCYLQAVNFAKFFAKTTACFIFMTNAFANISDEKAATKLAPTEPHIEQCSYFYEFNFSDPQLRKLEIRRAIYSMFFSVRIQKENAQPNRHILPKKMQDEESDYWFPTVVEQQLSHAGIRSDKPLNLVLTYADLPDDSAIGGHILRALSQTDLIRVQPNMVSEQERQELYQSRSYQLIHSEFCSSSQDPVQFLLRFHSKDPNNKTGYKNNEVDKYLERLQNEKLTPKERRKLIRETAAKLEQDVAILPLYQYQIRKSANSTN